MREILIISMQRHDLVLWLNFMSSRLSNSPSVLSLTSAILTMFLSFISWASFTTTCLLWVSKSLVFPSVLLILKVFYFRYYVLSPISPHIHFKISLFPTFLSFSVHFPNCAELKFLFFLLIRMFCLMSYQCLYTEGSNWLWVLFLFGKQAGHLHRWKELPQGRMEIRTCVLQAGLGAGPEGGQGWKVA